MTRSGPRRETGGRRVRIAVLALCLVLLLAVIPAPILVDSGHAATPSTDTGDTEWATRSPCAVDCGFPGGLVLASIFPLGGDRETPDRSDPEFVGPTDERAGDLFDVLSSETAREVLHLLGEEPRTASELAGAVDTTLQNVHYHLENLHEAGAITELDVEYSERGREMSVYTATCRPQVVVYDIS